MTIYLDMDKDPFLRSVFKDLLWKSLLSLSMFIWIFSFRYFWYGQKKFMIINIGILYYTLFISPLEIWIRIRFYNRSGSPSLVKSIQYKKYIFLEFDRSKHLLLSFTPTHQNILKRIIIIRLWYVIRHALHEVEKMRFLKFVQYFFLLWEV